VSFGILKGSLLALLLYLLLFYGLTDVGLLGPDEPRYAAIGREMAQSGDWVTPRLWGKPWFEKPALLYWMIGAAYRLGLGNDLAPRLPVALASFAFLIFYQRVLEREFGRRPAWFAAAMLATCAGWLSYSRIGVTDLPMSATFSAAMLLCLAWVSSGERRGLLVAGMFLGLAVLAKGLVPIVLALPLLWMGRKRLKDLVAPVGVMLAVSAPWYVLCTLRNGTAFLEDFFWKHHFERYSSEVLQHVQPFWFYLPVLLAAVAPWTPVMALLFRAGRYRERRRLFLLVWVAFGFVFLSAATNKLPGYLLPLLPGLCALMGLALAEARDARWVLGATASLLMLIPLAGEVLPQALLVGLSRAGLPPFPWFAVPPVLMVALAAWYWERGGKRARSVTLIVAAVAAGVAYMVRTALPALDQTVSARAVWRELGPRAGQACVEDVNRALLYGLNFYTETPLPECSKQDRPLHIRESEKNHALTLAPR
jgi:4-amino-4-deoxy-L-arabinose transferase-like glycosyltransferase